MKTIFRSVAILLLVSCAKMAPETATSSFEAPTSNPVVTATETFPSKTASPTQSPTNTPIALLPTYSFPSWMNDPNTNILAALVINELEYTRKVSFFKAESGENYEMLLPRDVTGYFWYDRANFGLLSKDLKTAYRINLQTGDVYTESISSQTTQFLIGEYEYHDYESSFGIPPASALEITKNPKTNEAIFRRARYGIYENKSVNGMFSADWDENRAGIIVTDNETNQIIWQSEPFQNTYGTLFRWSPKHENQLAYLHGKVALPAGEFITESITLNIVDVVTGAVLGNYPGDFGRLEWSPDGQKILYEGPISYYGLAFTDAPCILFLNIGEKRCLRSIPRLVPEGYDLVTTGVYEWGLDNETIYYTYIYGKEGSNSIGNLCMYSLVTSYIDCPTKNLEVLRGMTIINHDVSPDRQFLHFCYSASSILNDYADTAYDGVIKIDGSGFFSWEGIIQNGGPQVCSPSALWRPKP